MTVDLNKLYPEVIAIAGLLFDNFGGPIEKFVTSNPKVAMIAAVVAFIANKFATPPTVPAAPKAS